MGCCSSKSLQASTTEESIIQQFELELGLNQAESIRIDRVLHRYSSFKKMTEVQFTNACSELGWDRIRFKSFFNNFILGLCYQTKKLNCLGILLGMGSPSTKISLLFENYDDDISGTLSKSEIEKMVSHLVSVACVIIPNFC